MKIDLFGKTAIVTGSTEGIGLAVARGLARAGATVVLNGRSPEKLGLAVSHLTSSVPGAQVRGVAADLGSAEGCAKLVADEPSCDVLINNAGVFQPIDFFDADDRIWDKHWAVNVMSGVRLSRAYLPEMAKNGWGRVIFISSESGFNIPIEMIHYGVSKTADVALAGGLAKRMAGTGVTVNSILPGPTLSEGVAEMLREQQAATGKSLKDVAADFVRQHRSSSVIRRAASVDEVAAMVIYVASPLSSATTGAALRVDGGVIDSI